MTFACYQVKDYAESQPQAQVSVGAGSFSVLAGQGSKFPALSVGQTSIGTWERRVSGVVTRRERVLVTARSTDVITMTRSYGGDTAYQWETTDYFVMAINADIVSDMQTEIQRLETAKLNISDYQAGSKAYGSSSTGNDSYAITPSPAITSYTVGQTFRVLADVQNTGAASLNVNALGAKTIKKLHDQDLSTGDIEAGQIFTVTYDGTYFQMDSQLAAIPVLDINGTTEDTGGDITADFLIEYDTSAGANRKILPSRRKATNAEADTGSATNKFVDPAQLTRYAGKIVAGTSVQASSGTSGGSTASTTYVKLFQGTIRRGGTYTVSFDVFNNSGSGVTAYGRVYKNGAALGTERTDSGTDGSATSYSENLTFADGDTIEMRAKTSNVSYNSTISNFAVKYGINLDIHFTCA